MPVFGLLSCAIPEVFWSAYSGKPFLKRIDCQVPLTEANVDIVQKRFVAGEAVFEMAMCERCRDRMVGEYSEETQANITAYIRSQFEKLAAEAQAEADREAEKPRGPLQTKTREWGIWCRLKLVTHWTASSKNISMDRPPPKWIHRVRTPSHFGLSRTAGQRSVGVATLNHRPIAVIPFRHGFSQIDTDSSSQLLGMTCVKISV